MSIVLNEYDVMEARTFVESLMWDRCKIKHHTGDTMDPDTGQITPTYDIVYDATNYDPGAAPGDPGKCRFKMISQIGVSSALDRNIYDQGVTIVRALLHLPVQSAGIQVEDRVEIVSSLDPQLDSGMEFRIDAPYPGQTQSAVRRLWLEMVV